MSNSTKEKILESAESCFFQHGFQRTNMSLVSKYSGFSRVTVHKHFCTKKNLLRAVILNYFQSKMEEVEKHIEQHPDYTAWQAIEYWNDILSHPIFEQINDQYILEDLNQACNEHAYDIKLEMKQKMIAFIKKHIDRGIEDNEICLSKVGVDSLELATLIDNSMEAVVMNTALDKTKIHVNALFRVFKASTNPEQ